MTKNVWDMSDEEAREWSARNAAPNHVRQRAEEMRRDEDRQKQIRLQRDMAR